jgi:hypothetical protein
LKNKFNKKTFNMASLASTNQDQDSMVAEFMAFSGCPDAAQAKKFLSQTNWQLQNAVQLYFQANLDASTSSSSNSSSSNNYMNHTTPSMSSLNNEQNSPHIRAPDPVKRQRLLNHSVYAGQPRNTNQPEIFRSFRAEARQNRLKGKNRGRSKHVVDLTSKQKSLKTMFTPPVDLLFQGDFEMAKNAACSQGKWLLVCLIKNDEFACHALNRDVWTDEYVKAVIGHSFLFWMDAVDTVNGQRFATLYNVSNYPHVAFIDPRTGEQSKVILSGRQPITSKDFIDRVQDFSQRNLITPNSTMNTMNYVPSSSVSSRNRGSGSGSNISSDNSSTSSNLSARQKEEQEEEAALQAALAASMVDDGENDNGSSENDHRNEKITDSTIPNVTDYGSPPTEPDVSIPKEDTTRLRIRLTNGKQIVRKFLKTDTIRGLFSVVRNLLNGCADDDADIRSKNFELLAGYPPTTLSGSLDATLIENKLNNATVHVSLLN